MKCVRCLHKTVCAKFKATGGNVRSCDHFKEERRGAWIKIVPSLHYKYRCTSCGQQTAWQHKFCPNCGAEMIGVNDGREA